MLKTLQFRFTPPTHAIRAFRQALHEFRQQGGIPKRHERYDRNQKYANPTHPFIGSSSTTWRSSASNSTSTRPSKAASSPHSSYPSTPTGTSKVPSSPSSIPSEFYDYLADRQCIIYPGKLTTLETFRIGSIGELYQENILQLTTHIEQYLNLKQIKLN